VAACNSLLCRFCNAIFLKSNKLVGATESKIIVKKPDNIFTIFKTTDMEESAPNCHSDNILKTRNGDESKIVKIENFKILPSKKYRGVNT